MLGVGLEVTKGRSLAREVFVLVEVLEEHMLLSFYLWFWGRILLLTRFCQCTAAENLLISETAHFYYHRSGPNHNCLAHRHRSW